MTETELRTHVKLLLARQSFGVLATQGESGMPHLSIVAFLSADDLGSLVFATPRGTRKFGYLSAQPGAAFFVDDRRDRIDDLMEVTGIEAVGRASELLGEEREKYRDLFLAKYPAMTGFFDSPGSAVFRIAVETYNVVDHFQQMRVLPARADRAE
jgi:general stress protein 26